MLLNWKNTFCHPWIDVSCQYLQIFLYDFIGYTQYILTMQKNYTFTAVPITLKDTLSESGSYTFKIAVKYTKDDEVRESIYSGSLTVASKTTTCESEE